MKAIKITNFGDSSVLKYTDVDTPKPSNNEIIIKQEAIGVNFIDIYFEPIFIIIITKPAKNLLLFNDDNVVLVFLIIFFI